MAAVLLLALAFTTILPVRTAQAQSDRVCDQPQYHGVQHCAHDGGQTHVVVVDLTDQHVRLEVALPVYAQNGQEVTCAGVNVILRSTPGRGCSDPFNPGLYPTQPVLDIATRHLNRGVVAAINGDYMAANNTHGPEGFTVSNGIRQDGWENGDCDGAPWYNHATPSICHANDISRPSLALSRRNEPDLGWKSPQDLDDPRSYRYRYHNALGGGPIIVREGVPIADSAAACMAENFPPVVCTKPKQSALGVSGDLKRLVLITSSVRDAAGLASLFVSPEYGVTTAMKLDGGGSSQMWVRQGDAGLYYYVTNEEYAARQVMVPVGQSVTTAIPRAEWPRPLSQALLVLSKPIHPLNMPEPDTPLQPNRNRANLAAPIAH